MIIQCENCSRKFLVKDKDIPQKGRAVKCSFCSVTWHQMPTNINITELEKIKTIKSNRENDENPTKDIMKASDGKNYKFLGGQWAQLFPNGKTGLFAKKKISQELNKITGRKEKKISKKRMKKIDKIDPSSDDLIDKKKVPVIYNQRQGLGFFGYIFLFIIVGFSIVGILKTFEKDLINYFPDIEYIFISLDYQLEFLAESVKNIIVLIKDLTSSY